jgi:hypothetical protein
MQNNLSKNKINDLPFSLLILIIQNQILDFINLLWKLNFITLSDYQYEIWYYYINLDKV